MGQSQNMFAGMLIDLFRAKKQSGKGNHFTLFAPLREKFYSGITN